MEATQFDIIIETLKLSEVDVETMKARNKGLEKDIKVFTAPAFPQGSSCPWLAHSHLSHPSNLSSVLIFAQL